MFATRARLLALAAALVTPAVFAAGDIENGKTIFAARCGICHAVNKEPGAPARFAWHERSSSCLRSRLQWFRVGSATSRLGR
jgi:cytochrome c5